MIDESRRVRRRGEGVRATCYRIDSMHKGLSRAFSSKTTRRWRSAQTMERGSDEAHSLCHRKKRTAGCLSTRLEPLGWMDGERETSTQLGGMHESFCGFRIAHEVKTYERRRRRRRRTECNRRRPNRYMRIYTTYREHLSLREAGEGTDER